MSSNSRPIPDWAVKAADSLGPGPHVVVTGISPSGNIHVGNLREVLVGEAVVDALKARGEEVRFVFHADTIDPLRKIAPGVPEDFWRYIGHSLSEIPDPEGDCHESYAEHFLVPFVEALQEMGVKIEILRSHECYENGFYTEVTREALENREELRKILTEVSGRTALLVEDYWWPFVPRNSHGNLQNTRVIKHLPEQHKVQFEQFRPKDGQIEIREADYSRGEGKLQWRVELAARWKALQVTFEPFGKDHTSRGGSTDTADRMAREVFNYPPPGRYEYEWIQIKGRGAMSSSKGIVLLPNDMLDIMPPDALRRMVLGRDPARALDLDLAEGFPRFMDEYRLSVGDELVPFTHLVLVTQTVGSDLNRAIEMLRRGGYGKTASDPEKLRRDLAYARNWAEEWAPEQLQFKVLDLPEAKEAAQSLSEEQRRFLEFVGLRLGDVRYDADTIQNFLYAAAETVGLKPKQAFAAVYTVLLGKKSGPKAGAFISSLRPYVVQERFLDVSGDTTSGGAES